MLLIVGDLRQRQGLAKNKWPERLEYLDALPRTNIGKIVKRALREDIARRLEAAETGDRTARRSTVEPAEQVEEHVHALQESAQGPDSEHHPYQDLDRGPPPSQLPRHR